MIPTSPLLKSDIRNLIANGDLSKALEAALYYAEYSNANEITGHLAGLSGRLRQHINTWASGQISYEDFSREQSRVTFALNNYLEQLPPKPLPHSGEKKILEESVFKKRIFILLIISKMIVIGWVWNQWSMGTLNEELVKTVFSLLIPMFVTYFYIILDDYLREYKDGTLTIRRYVSGPLVIIGYSIFPLYSLIVIYILKSGMITHEISSTATMYTLLSFVETIYGGILGKVVTAFFKKESDT